VNDRGPYIGNRVLDLSYAAAQQIGLIEPGTGEVNIAVVKLGNGEREAPAPFEATIAEAPKVTPAPPPVSTAPNVEIPIPHEPVVVDRVEVEGVRKQVAADGKTIETHIERADPEQAPAPDTSAPATTGSEKPTPEKPAPRVVPRVHGFIVQVGAFSIEANANALLERLTSIGQKAWIARDDLYRVRLGPFATREQAVSARASLEAQGISAIIVSE
jgi:cell division septation protein DedD